MPKVLKKGKLAEGENTPPVEPNKPDETQQADGAVTCPECGAVFVPDQPQSQPDGQEPMPPGEYAAKHNKFVEAFGGDNGSKWFFAGMSFEAAQVENYKAQLAAKDAEITSLKSALAAAQQRLSAIAGSGESPLESSPPPAGGDGQTKKGFSSLFKKAS